MQYLGDDWIRAANDAVRANAATAPAGRLVIDQVVDGLASYRVTIERNACSITSTPAAGEINADATFRQDRATAIAVAQGETDAHQAFLLGHIRFEGDIDMLIERREATTWLESTLAPLIAATTFD